MFCYDISWVRTIGKFYTEFGSIWVEILGVSLCKGSSINFEISVGE